MSACPWLWAVTEELAHEVQDADLGPQAQPNADQRYDYESDEGNPNDRPQKLQQAHNKAFHIHSLQCVCAFLVIPISKKVNPYSGNFNYRISVSPCKYGCNTFGSAILPSSRCPFSSNASGVRDNATAVPFNMWTYSFLPSALMCLIFNRRAW